MIRRISVIFFMTGLAACGGGGSPPSYAELDTQLMDFASMVRGQGFTNPASLPASGTAAYQGVIDLEIFRSDIGIDETYGEIALTLDFADDEVRGRAQNFVNSSDELYAGRLTISNGNIDRSVNPNFGWLTIGELDGQLTAPDGLEMDVDAAFGASLLGNGSYFAGIVRGDASSSVDPLIEIEGGFIAERQ